MVQEDDNEGWTPFNNSNPTQFPGKESLPRLFRFRWLSIRPTISSAFIYFSSPYHRFINVGYGFTFQFYIFFYFILVPSFFLFVEKSGQLIARSKGSSIIDLKKGGEYESRTSRVVSLKK